MSRLREPTTSSDLSRRRLIQLGGTSLLGLGLPKLLAASSVNQRPAKSCIFIVQYGGGPHLDTFDLKPDAPREVRGLYSPIPTNVPGIQICEKLPLLASMADRYCLVRSMSHGNGGHMDGMHVCLSGQSNGSLQDQTPYFGSLVTKLRPATQNIPSYVWVQNLAGDVGLRYEGGGTLGAVYSPLRVGKDLENPSQKEFRFQGFDPVAGLAQERMGERFRLLQQLDPKTTTAGNKTSVRDFQAKALELITGPEARRAFDLAKEPERMRERYGWHPLGQNLLMARRLVEAGVRMVNVTAWCGVPEGEAFRNVQTWDMHDVLYQPNDDCFGNSAYGLNFVLPRFDQAVSTLLADLDERGLLRETLVVIAGEFGRTPTFEARGKGRGHWPNAYTALLAGGGIRGGAVYGESDAKGAFVKDKPVSPENFGATIYHALGVPPRFPDDLSKLVSPGEPMLGLFS